MKNALVDKLSHDDRTGKRIFIAGERYDVDAADEAADEVAEKPAPNYWDPLPSERTYYRHVMTGDRGWLVRREGKDMVKLDRPMQDIVRPANAEWQQEPARAPMTLAQVAQVMFEADKKLCYWLGLHLEARAEWASLLEEERLEWMEEPPTRGGPREALWNSIRIALSPYAK